MKQILFFIFLFFLSATVNAQNKVGIGTTTPSLSLHIHDSTITSQEANLLITNPLTGTTSVDGLRLRMLNNNVILQNSENGYLRLATNLGSHNFILHSNNTAGLNLLNPTCDLHISKFTSVPTILKLTNGGTGELATDGLDFSMDATGNASIMNNETGNLGIGISTPSSNFHIHHSGNNDVLITNTSGQNGLTLRRFNDSSINYLSFGSGVFTDWSIQQQPNGTSLNIHNYQTLNEAMTFDLVANNVGINNAAPDNAYSLHVKNPFGNNGILSQASSYGVSGWADSSGKIVGLLALPSAGVYGTSNGTFLTNGVYGFMNNNACTSCNAILGQALNGNTAIKAEATGLNSTAVDIAGSVRASGPAGNRFARVLTQTVASYSVDIPTSLSNSPNDILLVTHQFVGQYIPSAIGVWWDPFNNKWILYREDNLTINVGEKFNVICIKN